MSIVDAKSSGEIIDLVVRRAKTAHGVMRRDISRALGVRADNIISMWKRDTQKGMPLNQVLPFAHVTQMTKSEVLHLIAIRLDELNGLGTTIDTRVIALLMEDYAKLGEEDETVLAIMKEELGRIGWQEPVFSLKKQHANRERLRAVFASIVQQEVQRAAQEIDT